MFKTTGYNLMIVSPGDVIREREVIKSIIYEWNSINAQNKGAFLNPTGWDINSFPQMGEHPQTILNKQILNDADIIIGVFWTKIGTKTKGYESGSVEEISKHIEKQKQCLLYFSKMPVAPDSIDLEQYERLKEYKKSIQKLGLYREYENIDLFHNIIRTDLNLMMNNMLFTEKKSDLVNDSEKLNAGNPYIELLSETDKDILIEAAKDRSGTFSIYHYHGNIFLQINGNSYGSENDHKVSAEFEESLNKLENYNLIKATSYKREVFQVTAEGYRVAEKLKTNA